jgi:hypothetical protein
MGGDITLFGGGLAAPRYSRAVSRAQQGTGVALVRIDGQVAVEEAVVQGVAAIGGTAMRQIAMVSQLESQLGQLVPAAVSRLQAIGDMTALAMTDVVSDSVRRLNRVR